MEKEYKFVNGIDVEPNNIRDVVIVRRYGDELIRIHQITSYPNPQKMYYNREKDMYRETIVIDGFEFFKDEIVINCDGSFSLVKDIKERQKQKNNDIKLLNNLTRAKTKIFELALCNEWEYFITLTINRDKQNRYDLDAYHKRLSQFIRDYNKKYGLQIKFLLVPEKHKDGAWHEHGFIMGLPKEHLTEFTLSQKLPNYLRKKLKDGEDIYNWLPYMKKFGFCDLEPIKSHQGASYYVLKYITKDLQRSVSKLGGHLYRASQGLKKAEVVAKGEYKGHLVFDYENDYCKCNTLAFSQELLDYIISRVSDEKGYLKPLEGLSDEYLEECAKRGYTPRKGWINEHEKTRVNFIL